MPSVITPWSQRLCLKTDMSFPEGQYVQAVTFLCSGGDAACCDSLFLMTVFRTDKTLHISGQNPGFLIRLAFTGFLSAFWAQVSNGAGWFREHINAINSSAALSDTVKEQRGEQGMSSRSTTWNVCMIERGTDVVFVACVFVRQGVCQICIMRSVSLLHCMLLRGLPAVASSRSLFTNAFLFSSSSWLGMRPALPPSMWQACYRHKGRAVRV